MREAAVFVNDAFAGTLKEGGESLSFAAASKMAKRLLSYREAFVSAATRSYLPQESKRRFVDLMGERFDRIQAGIR